MWDCDTTNQSNTSAHSICIHSANVQLRSSDIPSYNNTYDQDTRTDKDNDISFGTNNYILNLLDASFNQCCRAYLRRYNSSPQLSTQSSRVVAHSRRINQKQTVISSTHKRIIKPSHLGYPIINYHIIGGSTFEVQYQNQ